MCKHCRYYTKDTQCGVCECTEACECSRICNEHGCHPFERQVVCEMAVSVCSRPRPVQRGARGGRQCSRSRTPTAWTPGHTQHPRTAGEEEVGATHTTYSGVKCAHTHTHTDDEYWERESMNTVLYMHKCIRNTNFTTASTISCSYVCVPHTLWCDVQPTQHRARQELSLMHQMLCLA